MASKELEQQQGDLEEGIQEGTKHNAAPVLADQSVEGPVTSIDGFLEVPVHHASRHAEVEGIPQELHAPNKLEYVQYSPNS